MDAFIQARLRFKWTLLHSTSCVAFRSLFLSIPVSFSFLLTGDSRQTGKLEKALEYYKLAEETFVVIFLFHFHWNQEIRSYWTWLALDKATLGDQNAKTIKARDGRLGIELKPTSTKKLKITKRTVQFEDYSLEDFTMENVIGKGSISKVSPSSYQVNVINLVAFS